MKKIVSGCIRVVPLSAYHSCTAPENVDRAPAHHSLSGDRCQRVCDIVVESYLGHPGCEARKQSRLRRHQAVAWHQNCSGSSLCNSPVANAGTGVDLRKLHLDTTCACTRSWESSCLTPQPFVSHSVLAHSLRHTRIVYRRARVTGGPRQVQRCCRLCLAVRGAKAVSRHVQTSD